MHAMQYEITLPADYDMRVIRRRVATRGGALDAFSGLGVKAFAIRERGVDGSPVNEYAPFYLWNSLDGMNRFLWSDGFRNLCDDFGRPVVQHWTGAAFERGPAWARVPRTATRSIEAVAPGSDAAAAVGRAIDGLRERAATPGVHSTALAVDPRHWEIVHYTLWEPDAPEVPCGAATARYTVLHLSAPEVARLPTGRHW
ncbi:DUF4865 family protein [Sphaerisporangium dianthi]|uniref:DUF4865 family protein n=1 Tax=Sphaerisporangium dianthi TaxID=1436120 RepID=A0ABV9CPX2_9ACTN